MTIDSFNKAMGTGRAPRQSGFPMTHGRPLKKRQIKKKLLDTKSPRLKEQVRIQYREKDREVKNSARQDKRQYIEQLAEEAEMAAEQKDMNIVYMITQKLRGDADKTMIAQ
jgi:transketolase